MADLVDVVFGDGVVKEDVEGVEEGNDLQRGAGCRDVCEPNNVGKIDCYCLKRLGCHLTTLLQRLGNRPSTVRCMEFEFESRFYALSASKAIFRARTYIIV